jgi:hypothetical protein
MREYSTTRPPNVTCRLCGKPFYLRTSDILPQGNYCSYGCLNKAKVRDVDSSFWARVDKDGANGCWEWTGARHANGYGHYSINRLGTHQNYKAHRFVYELLYGEIPGGLFVCHSCDNKLCVNPAHLWLGNNSDNILDAKAKGRLDDRRGELNTNSKLTPEIIRHIRTQYDLGATQSSLSTKFNLSSSCVCNIVHRRAWQHLP